MFETMVSFVMVEHLHGAHLRSAGRLDRLQPHAGAVAAAVPHVGRLSLHADLHRRAVAAVLDRGRPAGDDGRSALQGHGGAQPQHRRRLPHRRGAVRRQDHAAVADAVRRAGNPGGPAQFARRRAGRRAPRRHRLLQALHASDRGRGRDDRTCRCASRIRPRRSIACRRGSASTAARCCGSSASSRPRSMRWRRAGGVVIPGARRRAKSGAADGEDRTMQTLGLGFTWEQLSPGQRFRTLNRTVTETDLVMFTGVTGMLEVIFTDQHVRRRERHHPGPASCRPR